MGTLKTKWGPNGDPKSEKGPHGDPGPQMGTHVGAVQFGRHAKTADENGSNPIRLLKCHVRREKGPTRGPRGPSVAGRGAHVSPMGNFSGGQTKKIEVPFEPPETVSVPQLTFTFW